MKSKLRFWNWLSSMVLAVVISVVAVAAIAAVFPLPEGASYLVRYPIFFASWFGIALWREAKARGSTKDRAIARAEWGRYR